MTRLEDSLGNVDDLSRVLTSSEGTTRTSDETLKRIIEAATILFARDGYHRTSLNSVSELANINRGTIYYHVSEKEELLFEVLRQHVEYVYGHIVRIHASSLDPRSKIHGMIAFQVEALIERQQDVIVYERESHHLSPERHREFLDLQARVENVWNLVIQEGVVAGTVRPVDRVVVKTILGAIGSPFRWYRKDGRLHPQEIANHIADLMFYGLVDDLTPLSGR